MFRTLVSALVVLSVVSVSLAAPEKPKTTPKPNASVKPAASTNKLPPYNPVAERARFFKAAGKDSELDAKEFTADQGKDKVNFVRKADTWSGMRKYDKDKNGTINWFEADAYRRALRKTAQATVTTIEGKPIGGGAAPADAGRRWGASDPETIKKYDKDGDGKLNSDERFAAWGARAEGARQNFMKTYDKDGDGKLDEKEREAIRDGFRQRMEDWRRRAAERRYDKDGDGKLNDEEKAAMAQGEAARAAEGEKRRKEFMARYDTDGDGEVSSEKRKAIGEDMRRRWTERRYDTDRDGKLSDEEKAAMAAGEAKRAAEGEKRRKEYMDKYDTDGDGKISDAERKAIGDAWRSRMRDRFGGGRKPQGAGATD